LKRVEGFIRLGYRAWDPAQYRAPAVGVRAAGARGASVQKGKERRRGAARKLRDDAPDWQCSWSRCQRRQRQPMRDGRCRGACRRRPSQWWDVGVCWHLWSKGL